MNECETMRRATEIRQRINLYREYLAGGIEGERAVVYLREMKRLQAELDTLERDSDRDKRA